MLLLKEMEEMDFAAAVRSSGVAETAFVKLNETRLYFRELRPSSLVCLRLYGEVLGLRSLAVLCRPNSCCKLVCYPVLRMEIRTHIGYNLRPPSVQYQARFSVNKASQLIVRSTLKLSCIVLDVV